MSWHNRGHMCSNWVLVLSWQGSCRGRYGDGWQRISTSYHWQVGKVLEGWQGIWSCCRLQYWMVGCLVLGLLSDPALMPLANYCLIIQSWFTLASFSTWRLELFLWFDSLSFGLNVFAHLMVGITVTSTFMIDQEEVTLLISSSMSGCHYQLL